MVYGNIAETAAIVTICSLIASVCKASPIKNKWLPVICGVCGGALGVSGYYAVPGFPAQDIISALGVGIVSGFSATGINQVYKQLGRKGKD